MIFADLTSEEFDHFGFSSFLWVDDYLAVFAFACWTFNFAVLDLSETVFSFCLLNYEADSAASFAV